MGQVTDSSILWSIYPTISDSEPLEVSTYIQLHISTLEGVRDSERCSHRSQRCQRLGVTLRLHGCEKGEDAFNSVYLKHSKHTVLKRKHRIT